jgi:hypothetical protein
LVAVEALMDFTIKDLVALQELADTRSQVAVTVALLFPIHRCLNQVLLVLLVVAVVVGNQHLVDLVFLFKEIMAAIATLVATVLVVVVVHLLLQACVLVVLVPLIQLLELLIHMPLVELVLLMDITQEAVRVQEPMVPVAVAVLV